MTSEYQKMIAGEFYRPSDPELRALAQASRQKQAAFNKEEKPLEGSRNHQDLVCLNREKSLHQHSLDGGLRCQHPSRGKFLF
ncbi:maltose O-acetyltransferase [Streptococcus pneumoniae]|nr:maltose O-acetyltransferase [Streptococcus pneumoniae]